MERRKDKEGVVTVDLGTLRAAEDDLVAQKVASFQVGPLVEGKPKNKSIPLNYVFEDKSEDREALNLGGLHANTVLESVPPTTLQSHRPVQRVQTPGAFPVSPDPENEVIARVEADPEDPHCIPTTMEPTLTQADPVTLPTETAEPIDPEQSSYKRQRQRISKTRHKVCLLAGFLVCIAVAGGLTAFLVPKGKNQDAATVGSTTQEGQMGSPEADPWIWDLPFEIPNSTLHNFFQDSNRSFPVSKAFQWIKEDPNMQSYSPSQNRQRFVMAMFYFATNGHEWINRGDALASIEIHIPDILNTLYRSRDGTFAVLETPREPHQPQPHLLHCGEILPKPAGLLQVNVSSQPWLSYNHSECEWFSTAALVNSTMCNKDGQVVALDLEANNLVGSLPMEITLLPHLEILHMERNSIQGSLTSNLGRLANLQYVHFQRNSLTGVVPSEVGLLTNLWIFEVPSNQMSGSFPQEFFALSNLEYWHAGINHFTGSIPADIGSMFPKLSTLRLRINDMTGTLPSSIGLLSNLFTIAIWDNHFSGTLPTELGNLSSLRWMLASNNNLEGSIPSEIGRLSHLHTLDLGNMEGIVGRLPTELGLLNTLFRLNLKGTSITGTMPEAICGIPCLSFDCSSVLCGCDCPCGNSSAL